MAKDITDLLGGLALGFSQSMQSGQERALKQELLKLQLEQNKLQGKMNEAKLREASISAEMDAFVLDAIRGQGQGQGIPPQTQMQEIPPPQMAPQVAPQAMGQASPAGPIQDMIRAAALQHGVDPNFALAIAKHESSFNPRATSPKGAMGVMQLMPGTASRFGVTDPYDPQQNISGGMQYLKFLGDKFRNDPALMAAGYNAGENAVIKHQGVPPYAETQKFVQNVTGSLPAQIAQQQTRGEMPSISQTQPQPASKQYITKDKLVAGWLKKRFNVEPDEFYQKEMNGNLVIFKKDSMEPVGQIPGQGKWELQEQFDPASKQMVKRWGLSPASPLLPGVPVIGGYNPAIASGMQPGGFISKPPEIKTRDIEKPTGQKFQERYDVQSGEILEKTETKPQGLEVEKFGKMNMIFQASEALHGGKNTVGLNSLLFTPEGKINRMNLGLMAIPGGGLGKGTTIYSKMRQAINAALRLETGATANPGEVDEKLRQYAPSVKDTDAAIREKYNDFSNYVNRAINIGDPTGEIREMGKSVPSPVAPIPAQKKPSLGLGKKRELNYNPATGRAE